jgi:hypothetical protein
LLQTAKVLEAEKRAKKGWGFSTQSAGEGRGKKERKKEGGDLYRKKKKFGFEIPTKKKIGSRFLGFGKEQSRRGNKKLLKRELRRSYV